MCVSHPPARARKTEPTHAAQTTIVLLRPPVKLRAPLMAWECAHVTNAQQLEKAERDVSYQKKLTQYEANLHVAEWQFGDGSTRSASIYSLSPCTAIRTPDREHGYQDSASVYRATYDEVSLLRTRTRTRRTTSTS